MGRKWTPGQRTSALPHSQQMTTHVLFLPGTTLLPAVGRLRPNHHPGGANT